MKRDANKEMNEIHKFLGVSTFTNKTADIKHEDKDNIFGEYKRWSSEYNPMSKENRLKLLDFYKDKNKEFFNFLGYEIGDWNG